jgi:hypothetical protein
MMLASDHGVAPLPELHGVDAARPWCSGAAPRARDRWERPCAPGHRLVRQKMSRELHDVASGLLGPGAWIAGVIEPYVLLGADARSLSPTRYRVLVDALIGALERHPAVARAYDLRSLPRECPGLEDESIDALVCRSVVRGGPGDIYVLTHPGSFFDPDIEALRGTNHGTPYLYDRAVPLLVRAPGRVAAGRVIDSPLPVATFARTARALLGAADLRGGIDLTR